VPDATATPIACCSFCLKPDTEVKRLVAGPAVYVCDECVDLCCQIIEDVPAGPAGPRLLPWDRTDSLDAALANLLGATWAQVGDALGITRQSAWERFAAEG